MNEIVSPESATLHQVAEELLRLRERVGDLEDLRDLNAAIQRNAGQPGVPWDAVCSEFGWKLHRAPSSADKAEEKLKAES